MESVVELLCWSWCWRGSAAGSSMLNSRFGWVNGGWSWMFMVGAPAMDGNEWWFGCNGCTGGFLSGQFLWGQMKILETKEECSPF